MVLEVLVLKRALRLRHGVVEHRHHQAVLDVRAGPPRAASGRLLEQADHRPGDLPIEAADMDFSSAVATLSMRAIAEAAPVKRFSSVHPG